MVPLHPVVPSPYTILTQVPAGATWFIALDSKDAFFCIPLSEETRLLLAFEWASSSSSQAAKWTWTVLPQGVRDGPHLLGVARCRDLCDISLSQGVITQYMMDCNLSVYDNILICRPTEETSDSNSITSISWQTDGIVSPLKRHKYLDKKNNTEQTPYLLYQQKNGYIRSWTLSYKETTLCFPRHGHLLPWVDSWIWALSQTLIWFN